MTFIPQTGLPLWAKIICWVVGSVVISQIMGATWNATLMCTIAVVLAGLLFRTKADDSDDYDGDDDPDRDREELRRYAKSLRNPTPNVININTRRRVRGSQNKVTIKPPR